MRDNTPSQIPHPFGMDFAQNTRKSTVDRNPATPQNHRAGDSGIARSGDPGRTIQSSTRHFFRETVRGQGTQTRLRARRQIGDFRQNNIRPLQRHHHRHRQPLRRFSLPALGAMTRSWLPRLVGHTKTLRGQSSGRSRRVPLPLQEHRRMPVSNQHIVSAARLSPT